MAGRKAAKQAPAKLEEDDDSEGWEDAVVETESKEEADLRMRDWRDVERYREMKELRRLVDDDYGLEEIFHIPVRPRAEPGIPAGKGKLPKGALMPKALVKAAPPAKPPARPAANAHAKPAVPKTGVAKAAVKKPPAKPAPSRARARTEGLKAKAKKK